jgi:hypothetical protein
MTEKLSQNWTLCGTPSLSDKAAKTARQAMCWRISNPRV